jgi:hypothetical protein
MLTHLFCPWASRLIRKVCLIFRAPIDLRFCLMSTDTTTDVNKAWGTFPSFSLSNWTKSFSHSLLAENQTPCCLEYFLGFELQMLTTEQLRSGSGVEIIWMWKVCDCQELVNVKISDPITGLDRPWGFQDGEAPRFQDNRHMKVVRLSALRCVGRGTHFC